MRRKCRVSTEALNQVAAELYAGLRPRRMDDLSADLDAMLTEKKALILVESRDGLRVTSVGVFAEFSREVVAAAAAGDRYMTWRDGVITIRAVNRTVAYRLSDHPVRPGDFFGRLVYDEVKDAA